MKVLFVLDYPGYLRYFDSTVRELVDRGHEVVLGFNTLEQQAEGLEALRDLPQVRVVTAPPKRTDPWEPFVRGLRGGVDFVRYLDPLYADSPYLRDRMAHRLPPWLAFLNRVSALSPGQGKLLIRFLLWVERLVPSNRELEAFLEEHRPDVFLISPLVTAAASQTDLLKSARARRLRTALLVASWDHLTSKGLIRILPDRVCVWNPTQAKEARELHDVPAERVVVTGAQPWDRWFGRAPRLDREAFCGKVGLDPANPFVLFVGSTASISAPGTEVQFVRRWIEGLRDGTDPSTRAVGVLIRPHPFNPGDWPRADLSGLGNVAVFPRRSANPVSEDDRADYFDSMFHAAAVVGVNTSAMVEAAIVGRPVLAILDAEFRPTQTGTLHFRYLLPENGGFLETASGLPEHYAQLRRALDHPEAQASARKAFLASFVRPAGLARPATPVLAGAIERLADLPRPRRARVSAVLLPFTFFLWLFAVGLYARSPARSEKLAARFRLALRRRSAPLRRLLRRLGRALRIVERWRRQAAHGLKRRTRRALVRGYRRLRGKPAPPPRPGDGRGDRPEGGP